MKFKKVLATLLATAMSLTLLAGCGGNGGGESQAGGNGGESQVGASGETTDVSLLVWVPQNQIDSGIIQEQEEAFATAHPEWNITWQNAAVGEDNAKTEILKDVDAAADVFFFASDQLVELVDQGAIAQLGGDTEKMVKDTIAESVVATATLNGNLYAIPFTHNTFFMYYDKTLLDENDIKTLEGIMAKDTPDGTYNFMFDAAGGWKLGAFYYAAGLNIFGANGDDVSAGVDWNSETGVAITNYLIDLVNNPKCAYALDVNELISNHKLGAWWDGSWNYNSFHDVLGDDLGMAVIPTFNPDGTDYQLKGFYSSKCIGVNSHSKNMAAAVAFAAFLGNEENQLLRYTKSAQIPANINAGADAAVQADPMAAVIVNESNNCSVMQPVSSAFSSRYWNAADALSSGITGGTITKDNSAQALEDFAKALLTE